MAEIRTHLDLFSGIGGFALAAGWAGFKTVGFSEIGPYACKILKRHWPDVPNYGDIGNVPAMRSDLITGGPPCQPASCAGQRRGAEDDRWLWPEALACVERIRPTFCLFENPTGILSLNGGVEFEGVLSKLESLGYAVQPIVIPAVAVDARHRRDRVWIVANHDRSRFSRSRMESAEKRLSQTYAGGRGENVSDTNLAGLQGRNSGELQECSGEWIARPSNPSVSNTAGDGRRKGNQDSRGSGERAGTTQQWIGPSDYCRWIPEPNVGRVADGIPNRSHRLRCLGNAIVPQVAYQILKGMI